MNLDEPTALLVRNICDEWNRAERAIKVAEQVIGEDPFPSIKELRYAGRRIVEAFAIVGNGADEKAHAILQDAWFDCMRAKHDAMDVAVNEIAGRIRYSQEDLEVAFVIKACPNFPKLIQCMTKFENDIADSREDRSKRDEVYSSIQNTFDETMKLYDEFKSSEPLMMQLADEAAKKSIALQQREREVERLGKRDRHISYGIGLAGIFIAVVFGFLALRKPARIRSIRSK